jgi:hypothetical protein
MTAKRPKPPRPPRQRLRVGTPVASPAGAVEGANGFTLLIVTRLHADGTVDLAAGGDDRTWARVPSRTLVKLD